jgi:hypothetical protein
MQKIKIVLVVILIIVLWFSKDYFWYSNFKALYESTIQGEIIDIRQGRGGKEIKISKKDVFFSIYCDGEEFLKIGDSISKKSKSNEIKIYRKSIDGIKYSYFKSIYISKDLDFYSLIVEKK